MRGPAGNWNTSAVHLMCLSCWLYCTWCASDTGYIALMAGCVQRLLDAGFFALDADSRCSWLPHMDCFERTLNFAFFFQVTGCPFPTKTAVPFSFFLADVAF